MSEQWEKFTCKMPPKAYVLLEDELERIRLLADIDPDERLSQEVRDGLALEYICVLSSQTSDEEVV